MVDRGRSTRHHERLNVLGRLLLLGASGLVLLAAGALSPAAAAPAPNTAARAQPPSVAAGKQMLVTADELQYDYQKDRVAAAGHVQIYHDGNVLEADRVVYDRKTNKLAAEGNVRLKKKSGDVIYAQQLELSQDFKEGFVKSLRLETTDRTHLAGAQAERRDGDVTVLRSGVYTACEPCKDDPKKPPTWQIKAARIIHKEGERTIYYENATIEMFGLPIAWLPYFSTPDPTVTRKSGFLVPVFFQSTKLGFTYEMPYFWSIAPDYDLTLTPAYSSKQGFLMQGEWRQRFINGGYNVRAAGIFQQDKDAFVRLDGSTTPGYRDQRGVVETHGQFWLNEKWKWGWDATLLSDRTFLHDYNLDSGIPLGQKEIRNQIYLVGQGNRSYFDLRSVYYMGLSEFDKIKQLPVAAPILDYNYTFLPPVWGGELGFDVNLTSLNRTEAAFDNINGSTDNCLTYSNPDARQKCLLRGMPGTYTRLTGDLHWKRTVIDSNTGMVFTPFMKVRADAAWRDAADGTIVSSYVDPSNSGVSRAMPAMGVEYRWPLFSAQSWGTQIIEPIAQFIARPNETQIGKMPNEDAQSLVFDDTNLFAIDKYSGYDRVEGGGRLNAGVQYTARINGAGSFNALIGQSYHLFGVNSFAVGDMANTGLESGLDKYRSDYVARLAYQPDRIYSLSTHYRFDSDNFSLQRFELQGAARFDRINLGLLYGRYAPQPLLGYTDWREAVVGSVKLKVSDRWSFNAAARYDTIADRFDSTNFGFGYLDDCFGVSVNYVTDYTVSGNAQNVHKLLFRIDLRTIGEGGFSTRIGTTTSAVPSQ